MEFLADNYDLAATLTSGQAFRWRWMNGAWEGVVAGRWVRLRQEQNRIFAETATPVADWDWLRHYLQLDIDLRNIFETFPPDEPLQKSVQACAGLRLLRQEPWECLASFICSSTKQIVQIQQIIALLCRRFGGPLAVPGGHEAVHSFPDFARLAEATESGLRECKLGFRAPYLLDTARKLRSGEVDLTALHGAALEEARAQLLQLPGVGPKIADCVLLFGYGFQQAFPVDVWIMKALRQLYFSKRRVKVARLHRFSRTHFGPHSGYAQQYLFHYMRTKGKALEG
ncbi:MAG: DNA glycosylase [Verrucomicrobiota bacterium]|jgi:N-glycosylase/DNA lyase